MIDQNLYVEADSDIKTVYLRVQHETSLFLFTSEYPRLGLYSNAKGRHSGLIRWKKDVKTKSLTKEQSDSMLNVYE